MSRFRPSRTFSDLDNTIAALNTFERDLIQAQIAAIQYYIDVIIIRHFIPGNLARYKYTPLSPEYRKWKFKNFGNLPVLVLSGRLRDRMRAGRVTREGDRVRVRFNIPEYGRYQLAAGRNFIDPNAADYREMEKVLKRELTRIRKARIKTRKKA